MANKINWELTLTKAIDLESYINDTIATGRAMIEHPEFAQVPQEQADMIRKQTKFFENIVPGLSKSIGKGRKAMNQANDDGN